MKHIIFWIMLLLLSVGFSKYFNCSEEYCVYNGTVEKYNCHYLGCPQQPEWIQDVTEVKNITYSVVNCSSETLFSDLSEVFDSNFERFDKRINFTIQNNDFENREFKDKLNLSICYEKVKKLESDCVAQGIFNTCQSDLANCRTQNDTNQKEKTTNLVIGGLGGGALVLLYFNTKNKEGKKKPETDEIENTYRDSPTNMKMLQLDKENIRLKNMIDTLSETVSKFETKKTGGKNGKI